MKFIEYLFFAAVLTPTAVVLAAATISLAAPKTDLPASQAFQSKAVAEYPGEQL